jgi:hypothetical protein
MEIKNSFEEKILRPSKVDGHPKGHYAPSLEES